MGLFATEQRRPGRRSEIRCFPYDNANHERLRTGMSFAIIGVAGRRHYNEKPIRSAARL